MNTDLELYKIFCEVVKYKNISKTAQNIYITQSAVTQSIQKLEKSLGVKVFYRSKNGVELTQEGQKLYRYIKNSIDTLNNVENIFFEYINLEKGKIRIEGDNELISSLLYEPILDFIKKHRNIEIAVSNESTIDKEMQKLTNGQIDIAVLDLPYDKKSYANIEIISLKESKFCFFASKEYIRKYPIKEISEIERHSLIIPQNAYIKNEVLKQFCNKEKIKLNIKYEVFNFDIMKKLIFENVGIAFTRKENLREIIKDIAIIKELSSNNLKVGIAVPKKRLFNKAVDELIKEIKEKYA